MRALNTSGKGLTLSEQVKRQELIVLVLFICCLQKVSIKYEVTNRLNIKGWKKIHHADTNRMKTPTAILISEKVDFSTRCVTRIMIQKKQLKKHYPHS